MFDQPSLSDLSNSLAPPNVHTQCCVFPKSGVDQQEGAGCWKRSMIILGIWCIFELLLAVLCSVLCRAELGGWLPYHGRIKRSRPSSFDQGAACSDLSISLLLLVRSSPFISSLDQTSVHHSASSTICNSLKITNLAYYCWPKRKYMCVTLVVILLQIQKVHL